MTETPNQSVFPLNTGVSRSRSIWKSTLRLRDTLNKPRTHRLFASAGPKTPRGDSPNYKYEGILDKTWRVHALSPLFKFKASPVTLRQYGRSLDIAFSKGSMLTATGSQSDHQSTRSHLSIYHGLSFHENDPDAVRIQVTEKQDGTEKVVLTAILCSVDMKNSNLVDDSVADHFTFYPLLLVSSTKQRADTLIDWIQRHFDCRSSPMEFTNSDLRWLLALGCGLDAVKSQPVLLRYNLKEVCDGINDIDCKFESLFCKEVWDSFKGHSDSGEYLTENQVSVFVSALESHLEYTMHIIFAKLNLKEVGTPMCYVSKDGKLKILHPKGVYVVLHMICEVITWKYLQGYGLCG